MFEQSLLEEKNKTQKASSILISFISQIALICVLVVIPLIYFEAIPMATLSTGLVAPPPPPPPPPPPAPVVKVVKTPPRQIQNNVLLAPKTIPKDIAIIKEEELPPVSAGVTGGVPGGVPGGVGGGVLGGVLGSIPNAAPPPPPPPKEKPATPQRIRVGGNVQAAKLVRQPKPVYPQLAKQARIQGVVKFTAVIGKDGTIQNLQLVSGHPLLVQAAQDAVKQWVYQPTQLNGEPVEVITQIDVNFTLSQ
jgi:periplasmic protein TonB